MTLASKAVEKPSGGQWPHPGVADALVLVTPHDKVQKPCQVALLDVILGIGCVGHSVLVKDHEVEPLIHGELG